MGFEKFKPLLEKYSLLKIIYKNDEVFNPFVKYYKPSAFENPMEDPQIINHLKINFHDKGYLIKTSPNPNIKFTVVDNND